MKRVIKWARKHDNLVVCFIILLSIVGISLNVKIIASDELWNFQNIYKLYNGFEIYKDANIITTPLFFYVGNLLFKLMGANFFTFRVYNIIIDIILFLSTYILCKKLKISKKVSLLIVLILLSIYNFCIVRAMANYNILALAFFIIGVINILKEKMTTKDYILQGVIAFLIFATKQNIGIYYIMANIIFQLQKSEKLNRKIKNLSIELLTFVVLTIILILFLMINNNLNGFINYAIMGISEFGTENLIADPIYLVEFTAIALIDIIVSYILIKKVKIYEEKTENLKKLNIFAFFLMLTIIPIMNLSHFLISGYLYLIILAYIITIILSNIIPKQINKSIKIIEIITLALIFVSMYNFIMWIMHITSYEYEYKYTEPFYGGIVSNKDIRKINNIEEYVQNNPKRVIILSNKSAMYMVPLKRNNGEMDLPFKGNLGKGGEQGLIEEIKNLTNAEILIEKNEENVHGQESKLVRNYIMQNLKYNGEIEEFLIYSTK